MQRLYCRPIDFSWLRVLLLQSDIPLFLLLGYHTKGRGNPMEALIKPVYIQLPDPSAKVIKVEAGTVVF